MLYTYILYTIKRQVMTKSKNRRALDCHVACSVEIALDIIGGKWKGVILYHLLSGTKRFSELQRLIPSVAQRMLTQQLRQLEEDGIIARTVYPVIPPKVEYTLTPEGEKLEKLLIQLRDFGRYWSKTQMTF